MAQTELGVPCGHTDRAFGAHRRRGLVKAAMQHAWSNYVKYAFGQDELMPRSLRGKDPFGGMGATILDSLDTLWLMDMQAEYKQARDWVANDLNFTRYVLVCCTHRRRVAQLSCNGSKGHCQS